MMKSLLLVFATLFLLVPTGILAAEAHPDKPAFITEMAKISDQEKARGIHSIGEKLSFRARQQPFLLVATVIFILAIAHTFFAIPITRLAHQTQHEHDAKSSGGASFRATTLHFLGEVEAIFGIWAFVLLAAMFAFYDLTTVKSYMMGVNFTEPLFVVVIMIFASTRPILRFAERSEEHTSELQSTCNLVFRF